MEQQIIANGGLQYIPQIAVQYVYLDFDGELTSYNGENLTVDNVEVKDSALTGERIADIVAGLNAKYALQNVIFVTEKPETAEYSTIFIGKTSAFDEYGNFAGLAETIDSGNKNKSDNAFVMLDSTFTDAEIISTISHETDHLLGTLDHGGEGLNRYAHTACVFTGAVNKYEWAQLDIRKCNLDDEGIYYAWGRDISVNSGGVLLILSGAVAEDVYVYNSGRVAVHSGAVLSKLYLYHGGFLDIAAGGNYAGELFCSGGGLANFGTNIEVGDFAVFSGCDNDTAGITNGSGLFFTIGSSATFVNCTSSWAGGAINNMGYMTIDEKASFLNNYAERGGAIYNEGNMTIAREAVFSGNSNWYPPGGAGAILNTGKMTIGENALFENNRGIGTAAVTNYGTLYIGKGTVFKENTTSDGSFATGGAITNDSGLLVLGEKIMFQGNTCNNSGCAIYNRYGTVRVGNENVFSDNKAVENAVGTIYNIGVMHLGEKIIFRENSTVANAGAIYNGSEMNIAGNMRFENNVASKGGAIYNESVLALGNNIVFSGNNANFTGNSLNKNDAGGGVLYNKGTVYLQDAVFATASDQIYNDGTIVVNGYVSFAGNLQLDDYSLLQNNGSIEFNITNRKMTDDAFINTWEYVKGDGEFIFNIAPDQSAGDYKIAEFSDKYSLNYLESITKVFTLRCGDQQIGNLSIDGDNLLYNGLNYNLTLANETLYLTIRTEIQGAIQKSGNVKLYKDNTLLDKAASLENICLDRDTQNRLLVSAGGTVREVAVSRYTDLYIFDNGEARGTVVTSYGSATVLSGGRMYDTTVSRYGYMCLSGGTAYNTMIKNGSATVKDGGIAQQLSVSSGYVTVYCNGSVDQLTVSRGSAYVSSGGVMTNTTVSKGEIKIYSAGTACNTILSSGGMCLSSGAVHRGTLQILSDAYVYVSDGAIIDLTVASRNSTDDYLITGYSEITNYSRKPIHTITVSATQEFGTYKLIQGIDTLAGAISISTESGEFGQLTVNGGSLEYHNKIYTLTLNSMCLDLTIQSNGAVSTLNGTASGLTWTNIPGSEYFVEYSLDGFATNMRIETSGGALDSFGMVKDAQCRISCDQMNWTNCSVNGKNSGAPQKNISTANGNTDIFFAAPVDTWGKGYAAEHCGILNDWNGTGEQVNLAGKNRIEDVFEGSADANILVLTDDANGDALFADDIYTTFGKDAARLAQIDEIRAGAGDDVIDLTSQQFAYVGEGIKIYGGDGNDTIWANRGENILFGDAGNDRIVGGSGDDIISGGAGNDSLNGGGGNDIFCFGGDWGDDIVQQADGGKITLCIDDGLSVFWNSVTLTYSDGKNSIKVCGADIDDITLIFDGEAPVAGAFLDAASEKIFEDKNSGMLA